MRIVQLANFYGPGSGGLRTAVDAVGRGYEAQGHERVLLVPGPADSDVDGSSRQLTVRSPRLPRSGGYRVITDRQRVSALLDQLRPDRVEVSDKFTLGFVGDWARRRDVPSVLWSHERLDAILRHRVPRCVPLRTAANRWNQHLGRAFDTIVCTSRFGADEFDRDVVVVPLGVDLELFRPATGGRGGRVRVVTVGRLSSEKRPELALLTVALLRAEGLDAELTFVGDGPERARMVELAAGLPVRFTGHLDDRAAVAAVVRNSDVALLPCPVEAFGLSVLEALACGTPVVVADTGAAGDLVVPGAGRRAPAVPAALAEAVAAVAGIDREASRAEARARAEAFPWSVTVDGMLAAHGATAMAHR